MSSSLTTNMTDEHLLKEVGRLKDRFPKLDNMYLLDILIEKEGPVSYTHLTLPTTSSV